MTQEELLTTTALASWKLVIGRFNQALGPLPDDHFQKTVAPGKNRLLYLIGHLTATNDRLLPMLGLGQRLHPELDKVYIENPDRTLPDPISTADLRKAWNEVNTAITSALEGLTPNQWLQRHTAVSEEDFAKDPLRNRLAVVLSRTSHVSFHLGQAALIK